MWTLKKFGCLLGAAALLILAAGARAQWTQGSWRSGSIAGVVRDAAGIPIAKARVTLQPGDAAAPKTTLTDKDGHFLFKALPRGLYDLRAYSQGRISEWHKGVTVTPGKRTAIALKLHPEEETKKEPAEKDGTH